LGYTCGWIVELFYAILYLMKQEKIVNKESEHRKIAYTEEFRNLIREYPGIIRRIREILRSQELVNSEVGDVFEFDERFNGKVTRIKLEVKKNLKDGSMTFYYLKLDVDGGSFFIKSEFWPSRGKGYDEFVNTQDVKRRLKNLSWVGTVEHTFGYQEDGGQTFFISEWVDFPLLRDYMVELRLKIEHLQLVHDRQAPDKSMDMWEQEAEELRKLRKQEEELEDKMRTLQEVLPEFHDLSSWNMFYDEENQKIYLFDLFKTDQSLFAGWKPPKDSTNF